MEYLVKVQVGEAEANMQKALLHCEGELTKIRAGKASAGMLDGIYVDYYGSSTQLAQVASVNTPDARTITVQPWEKQMLTPIERAIQEANIGLNPQNDGTIIRLVVPPLTEERRKELVKRSKEEAERGKVTIRNSRKEANDHLKKLKAEGISDDEIKAGEAEIQKLTDAYVAKADKLMEAKEKDIMTV